MLAAERTMDRNLAYLFFRVFLGINIFGHGVGRIYSGAARFATELVSQFAKTPLPSGVVYLTGVTLPFAELVIGVLILIGLWSRLAYCAGFHRPYLRFNVAAGLDRCRMATALCIRLCDPARVS
jgi:uncharacterized membrane protein YphA (DoxX/SURF4 family)